MSQVRRSLRSSVIGHPSQDPPRSEPATTTTGKRKSADTKTGKKKHTPSKRTKRPPSDDSQDDESSHDNESEDDEGENSIAEEEGKHSPKRNRVPASSSEGQQPRPQRKQVTEVEVQNNKERGYPRKALNITTNSCFPTDNDLFKWRAQFKSMAAFGNGAMSSAGPATTRTREIVGRLSAKAIRFKFPQINGNSKRGKCIFCHMPRPLNALVKFTKVDQKEQMDWGGDWAFVDIIPIGDVYFRMYQDWPEAWTVFTPLDTWIPMGRCCASSAIVLGMILVESARARTTKSTFTPSMELEKLVEDNRNANESSLGGHIRNLCESSLADHFIDKIAN